MSHVLPLLAAIDDVGRDASRGGYSRPVYSPAELTLREWFVEEATRRGLSVEADRNANLWAWWDVPSHDRTAALVTGSHLDSVPGGGAYDGPLGVASALATIDELRRRADAGTFTLTRALAILVPAEEEGSRFGVACLGSRLLTGATAPERALGLTDPDGSTFAEASAAAGFDPKLMGRDDNALSHIGHFVELHVEQGRGLDLLAGRPPLAVATSILGHGRWRASFTGQGNHAGTTLMEDRADPMIAAAAFVLAVRDLARRTPDARSTVGRLVPIPGGANVIASRVEAWFDVRHPDDGTTLGLVADVRRRAEAVAVSEGCRVDVVEESFSPTVDFDTDLASRVLTSVRRTVPAAPLLATGAGHDAGVLAAHVPTAMVFVRNPTGVSHSPEESADDADVERGARALADVLADLT